MSFVSDGWYHHNNLSHSRKDIEQIVSMIYIQVVNSIWVAVQKNDGQQMFLEMFPSALPERRFPMKQQVSLATRDHPALTFQLEFSFL